MELRAARAGDVGAVQRIVERAYGIYVERMGRRPPPMDHDYGARVDRGQVVLAAQSGELLGLIVLLVGVDHLLVENVAVDPGHHGHGVGSALLAHAEDTAAALGLGEVRLYTNAAMTENLAFYPRRGYREAGHRAEGGLERVFFAKTVPAAS